MASEEEVQIELFKDVQLGNGAFGMVCRGKYDQLPCAAKLLHPTLLVPGNWAAEKFMQECSFLASLKHPHIVQFLGVHTDASTGQAVLLMELMDESLTKLLKRHKSSNHLPPVHVQADICHDVALALHYLHTKGIIHRDLSSNNVLLLGGCRAKITDFGMSKLAPNVSSTLSSLTQVPGCPVYMPPEAWVSPPIYTEKLDVFSFGVLTLQIATCCQPNPGPLETLIPDERSPTGFLKLPVPEVQRRREDLSMLSTNHPFHEIITTCLSDKQDNRPSSRRLCGLVECVKESSEYIESKRARVFGGDVSTIAALPATCSSDSGDSGYTDSVSRQEIQSLKLNLANNEAELVKLEVQLSNKEARIGVLQKELEEIKSKDDTKQDSASKTMNFIHSSFTEKTISNLSPEILSILKSDSNMSQTFNVDYSKDSVTFYHHSQKEDSERRIKLFLQMYQRLFNTGQVRINFVPIPTSLSESLLHYIIAVCNQQHNECVFELVESVNMIKVLSKSQALNQLSTNLVSDMLNLTISLPGGRKLIFKHESVVDQRADVLVCASRPNLTLNIGLSATMNTMSNFELQKYCSQYIQKNGPLQPGQVVNVPAAGSLLCKWVVLGVGPSSVYSDDKDTDAMKSEVERIMRTVTAASLDKAEKLRAGSLALPLIGFPSSDQKFSTNFVIDTVVKHKYHWLKEITLAVGEERFVHATCEVLLDNAAFWTRKEYDYISNKINSSKSCKQQ